MHAYNFEEVIADIQHFEGVGLRPKELFPGMAECRYHKLYSEVFPKRLASGRTVNDLNARLDEYFNNIENVIPVLDPDMTDEYDVAVYAVDKQYAGEDILGFYACRPRFVKGANTMTGVMTEQESHANPFVIALDHSKRETTFWSIKHND